MFTDLESWELLLLLTCRWLAERCQPGSHWLRVPLFWPARGLPIGLVSRSTYTVKVHTCPGFASSIIELGRYLYVNGNAAVLEPWPGQLRYPLIDVPLQVDGIWKAEGQWRISRGTPIDT
jgi:hypothetical protein